MSRPHAHDNPGFSLEIALPDEKATEALGAMLAQSLRQPLVLTLSGDLGAGKTTLTRGFLRACGYLGAVKSPTFTLVESYEFGRDLTQSAHGEGRAWSKGLHHFDLYRVADPEELDFIGFEEYFEGQCDVVIEWPELGGDRILEVDFYIALSHQGECRQARLEAQSETAVEWLKKQVNENKFIDLSA